MSHQLINLSPDLKRLRDEGFNIAVEAGILIVNDIPYVTPSQAVAYGTLVTPLSMAGDITTKPATHIAYFAGEHPCHKDGTPMVKLVLAGQPPYPYGIGLYAQHMMSNKPFPLEVGYADYYELMTTYINIISAPVHSIDSLITARTYPVIEESEVESVFCYMDTASSRAGISAVARKLALGRIAIIGLGGTGSYVLDLVAKTPVNEIHLFDRDVFSQHNAFRAPGAPSLEQLRSKPQKVDYLASVYAQMRRNIIPHNEFLTEENVDQLLGMDFIFLCLDRGTVKHTIIARLEAAAIPFVDVGMGIYLEMDSLSLGGIVRVTTSTQLQRDHVHQKRRISFGDGAEVNEYQQNIQIADLNALNAALAVIKWKKLFGFYLDLEGEHHSTYTIDGNSLINEDHSA
ncbi:ThiF family adenylyltransferase [Nibrella viscosa]|uniref:ThiF family adenylyltransferase n=1 Tax=Nibrella viscosa TaxID=1084524 RepID=A0ABP8KYH4_9BACT